jgi:hypothetical protein
VNFDQPKELTEHMRLFESLINSEMNLDQPEKLIEEDNLRRFMMIGGIGVFLPFSQEEAEVSVADDAAAAEEQSVMTVREEEGLEQTLEVSQVDEEDEHSEEWIITFSQEAERVVALELTAEEAEEDNENSEEWLNIFSQEAERTTTWEFAAAEEKVDNICFVDLWE